MQRTLSKQTWSVLLAFFAFSFFLVGHAQAAYESEQLPRPDEVFGDYVVGPGRAELVIAPGETKIAEISVANRLGEDREFSLVIEDAQGSRDPDQTVVLLGDDRGPYSIKDYISVPESSFTVKQGERVRIPVSISVPADAEPGGLYGSVLITTVTHTTDDLEGQPGARPGSTIVSRIGTLFFVTVPGDVSEDGVLVDFSTIPDQTVFKSGPIDFQILFENKGSVHLNPYGEVRIKNILGEEVGQIIADPWFAFPDSVRFREVSWDRPFMFGYYTAEANINRGYDDIVDTMKTSFVVIPVKHVVGGVIALIALFFLLRLIARNIEIKRRDS